MLAASWLSALQQVDPAGISMTTGDFMGGTSAVHIYGHAEPESSFDHRNILIPLLGLQGSNAKKEI